ncbi:FecR family protein [Aquimarina hainanensis]|uniref:FecR family protein n=1 Tax=Aquimarina hainanensis TaxID=1578017 RepID=A0ABW5N5A8_9FLAO
MDDKHFLFLLEKYLAKKATPEEEQILMDYYESFQEKALWNEQIESEDEIKKRIYSKIKNQIQQDENSIRINNLLKYAAVFIGLIGSLYFFKNTIINLATSSNTDSLISKRDHITLTLDNGKIETLSEDGIHKIVDTDGNVIGEKKGNEIKYFKNKKATNTAYNKLSIPFGKRLNLVLSDGTKVKLNSGSTISYPTQFSDKETRHVSIQGEAYFDVVKDPSRPFIVDANQIHIKVLGTQFNVSHYGTSPDIQTVLVEGAIELYNTPKTAISSTRVKLTPGQKGSWNKTAKKIIVDSVDVQPYIAWIQGKLVFKKMSFIHIAETLERHFDIQIKNDYPLLNHQIYSASFNGETIEEILKTFSEDTPFSFTRKGNIISITK